MKKNIVVLVLFVFLVSGSAFSQPFELIYLNSIKMHPSFSNGLSFDTYEDIEEIEFAPYSELPITYLNINNIPNIMTVAEGNRFFNGLTPYIILSETDVGADFLNSYFFLDGGHYDREDDEWKYSLIGPGMGSFPFIYDSNLNTPHHRSFCLCIRGGFRYIINPPRLQPNGNICDYGMCNCTPLRNACGNVINWHPNRSRYNNLYVNFRSNFLRNVSTANEYKENQSGIGFSLNLHDRTPPTVGETDDSFPTQEGDFAVTTNDAYSLTGLTIDDNSADVIGYVFTMGHLNTEPHSIWQTEEVWNKTLHGTLYAGNPINREIFFPERTNRHHGVVRYSIFAWDEDGNINRTESQIVEDEPRVSYGSVPSSHLGTTMYNARQFRDRLSLTNGDPATANISGFDYNNRRSVGLIRIIDNDLPNIAIRITSSKNPNEVFYFPPVSDNLYVNNSKEYRKAEGITNKQDYISFATKGRQTMFSHDELNKPGNTLPLYYKIMDIKGKLPVNDGDKPLPDLEMDRFSQLINSNSDFVRKNIRLEDYLESDTGKYNQLVTGDYKFGNRHGTGRETVAYMLMDETFSVRIQEDVEYTIDVWMDDNVKWANTSRDGAVLDQALKLPTGIVDAKMRVCIPNQYPIYDRTVNCDTNQAINGDLKVVFREPTPNVKITSEADLVDNKFPYIEMTAEDHSGLKRTIRLYLKINDESASIRTLDRKHKGR